VLCLFSALCLVYGGFGLLVFNDLTVIILMLFAAPLCYFSGRIVLVGRL